MNFYIKHQKEYSRLELLARSFFGWIYIGIPHMILIYILGVGVYFCQIALFYMILFTGKYPKGMFDFVEGTFRLYLRIISWIMFFTDGYPEFTGDPTESENKE